MQKYLFLFTKETNYIVFLSIFVFNFKILTFKVFL